MTTSGNWHIRTLHVIADMKGDGSTDRSLHPGMKRPSQRKPSSKCAEPGDLQSLNGPRPTDFLHTKSAGNVARFPEERLRLVTVAGYDRRARSAQGAAEPLRPHGARRSPIGPICALGSRAHADDGVLSVRPSEAAQRHLPIAAPSRSSPPQGQACSLESRKAAPGWLLPLSPTNGGNMRARRGHQARRSLTVGLRTPGPAGHPGSLRAAAILPWWAVRPPVSLT